MIENTSARCAWVQVGKPWKPPRNQDILALQHMIPLNIQTICDILYIYIYTYYGILDYIYIYIMLIYMYIITHCTCTFAAYPTPRPLQPSSAARSSTAITAECLGFRVSGFQGFRVSGFQGFRVSGFRV